MLYHNQKQLDTDTEKFFCLLKLHAHFKDHNKTQTSNQLYQAFKVETRTKWTHKETHHTLETFIYLVQHDKSKIKPKKVKNSWSNLQTKTNETSYQMRGHNYNHCRQRRHSGNYAQWKLHQRGWLPIMR